MKNLAKAVMMGMLLMTLITPVLPAADGTLFDQRYGRANRDQPPRVMYEFNQAVADGKLSLVKQILGRYGPEDRRFLLNEAIISDGSRFSPSYRGSQNSVLFPPLLIAVQKGNVGMVRYLLSAGAYLAFSAPTHPAYPRNGRRLTALHVACLDPAHLTPALLHHRTPHRGSARRTGGPSPGPSSPR